MWKLKMSEIKSKFEDLVKMVNVRKIKRGQAGKNLARIKTGFKRE